MISIRAAALAYYFVILTMKTTKIFSYKGLRQLKLISF